ncbi:hypothetical protein [Methanoculleus sp. 10]|uniref:hypothetical protein n=1 Tax=Methanoculleus sp. 10 TaxID=430615 RepID=UPI0025FC614F|nr:hypothetical protein [Methanoculleus sp. 10]
MLPALPVLGVDTAAGIVGVAYIDADDSTPVLDIKPYFPSTERICEVRVPAWSSRRPQWYEENTGFDRAAEFTSDERPGAYRLPAGVVPRRAPSGPGSR